MDIYILRKSSDMTRPFDGIDEILKPLLRGVDTPRTWEHVRCKENRHEQMTYNT